MLRHGVWLPLILAEATVPPLAGPTMHLLTILFILALTLMVGVRWWLATRQLKSVRAHRGAVPAPFAAAIPLADHERDRKSVV